MKREIIEVIHFDRPSEIEYWSKKWEISPFKLFATYMKIKSNHISDLKQVLRSDGFAV